MARSDNEANWPSLMLTGSVNEVMPGLIGFEPVPLTIAPPDPKNTCDETGGVGLAKFPFGVLMLVSMSEKFWPPFQTNINSPPGTWEVGPVGAEVPCVKTIRGSLPVALF